MHARTTGLKSPIADLRSQIFNLILSIQRPCASALRWSLRLRGQSKVMIGRCTASTSLLGLLSMKRLPICEASCRSFLCAPDTWPRNARSTCLARLTAHSENKDEADLSVRRGGVRALRDGRAPRPPAAPTPGVCVISNGDRKCLLYPAETSFRCHSTDVSRRGDGAIRPRPGNASMVRSPGASQAVSLTVVRRLQS